MPSPQAQNERRPHRIWPIATLVAVLCATAGSTAIAQPTALERGILAETNRARTDPAGYAAGLEEMLAWFEGDVLVFPDRPLRLRTAEGPEAVREAIAFLKAQSPLEPLTWSDGLWRAARDHARDQGRTGGTGHGGSDGSTPWDRMARHGQLINTGAENIDYGSETAREVVIALIVDDGVPDRGHRTNIFATTLRTMGAGCGPHPQFRRMCAIAYAGGFTTRER